MYKSLVVFSTFASFAVLALPELIFQSAETGSIGVPSAVFVSGVVEKAEDGMISIKTDHGTRQYNIRDDVTVTRNSLATSLVGLHPGDLVKLAKAPNSEIVSITAVTGKSAAMHSRATAALPGFLLLALLPYFMRRTVENGQQIRTSYVS